MRKLNFYETQSPIDHCIRTIFSSVTTRPNGEGAMETLGVEIVVSTNGYTILQFVRSGETLREEQYHFAKAEDLIVALAGRIKE